MKSLSGLNNDQADSADPDGLNDELTKLVITKHRPKIPDCIATDDEDWEPPEGQVDHRPKIPDCIATDDEDWEPPVWLAWDKWDQKVNAQEDWTWHYTLKYKAKKGGRLRGLDLAQHAQVQGQGRRTLKRIGPGTTRSSTMPRKDA